jgi:hypothetical protein
MEFYFTKNGKTKGPVSKRSLISLIEYGNIQENDSIKHMTGEWQPIRESEFKKYLSNHKNKNLKIGRKVVEISKDEDEMRCDIKQLFKRPRAFFLAKLNARGLRKDVERWVEYYGIFDTEDYSKYNIKNLVSETGCYSGELVA